MPEALLQQRSEHGEGSAHTTIQTAVQTAQVHKVNSSGFQHDMEVPDSNTITTLVTICWL